MTSPPSSFSITYWLRSISTLSLSQLYCFTSPTFCSSSVVREARPQVDQSQGKLILQPMTVWVSS